jgi:hypothetical protein
MLPPRPSLRLAVAALLVGVVSCGDPTGPADPAGTYALRSYDGRPLPFTTGGTPGSGFVILDAETVTFGADDTVASAAQMTRTAGAGIPGSGGSAESAYVQRQAGTWARAGDEVTVRYPSAAGPATVYRLRVSGEGAELTGTQRSGTAVWRYQRQ